MTNDEDNKNGRPKAISLLDEYMTEAEFAAEVHREVRTVRRWRDLGIGPKCVLLGRQRLYRRETARAWLQSLEQDA